MVTIAVAADPKTL